MFRVMFRSCRANFGACFGGTGQIGMFFGGVAGECGKFFGRWSLKASLEGGGSGAPGEFGEVFWEWQLGVCLGR